MSADVHTLIGPWVLDAVDDEERVLVERHLTECAECAQEAAELRETVARLTDVTIAEPPAGLRERVLHAAHRTRQEAPPAPSPEPARPRPEPAPRHERRRLRLPRWRLAFGAAAIAVAAAFAGIVGTWAILQSGTGEQDRMTAVLEAADAEVAFQEAEGGGRVTVIASESLDDAVVVVSDLAAVGEDRSYQVWLVDADGQESAGVMDPGDSSATMLVEGLGDADVIGVTDEPAGGSASPTLPMVADVVLPA